MKKNILIVIDSLTSGGAEKSLISLLTLFDYDKYNVDLLLFYQRGLYLPLIPKEVNIIEPPEFLKRINKGIKGNLSDGDIKALYLRSGLSISCRNPLMTKKYHGAQIIYKWLSKGIKKLDKNYDVAIAYSQGMPTYYVAEKVQAKRKLAWVNIDYKVAGYNKDFDMKYYEKFDKVVAVSHSCKDVLIEEIPILENKVDVIYDIISDKLIKNMAKEEGGFSDNFEGIRILTIGRIVYQKGYEMAIEAAAKLKQDGFNFRWYAIGEGKLKEKLENRIAELNLQDNFIFLGTYQNPYTFLKQTDIYVQPSRYEGYGLVIAEARILHKPIVATNFTVVHNQILNEKNGLISEMNSQSLYECVKRMIEDYKLRKHVCENLNQESPGTEEEILKIYKLIEDK
ncbi:MAG: glycosyltransferase [Peptostreptococcaceae bacterium]|nr:glycosyltransferase [Peptostreptococcaceae bacterium]